LGTLGTLGTLDLDLLVLQRVLVLQTLEGDLSGEDRLVEREDIGAQVGVVDVPDDDGEKRQQSFRAVRRLRGGNHLPRQPGGHRDRVHQDEPRDDDHEAAHEHPPVLELLPVVEAPEARLRVRQPQVVPQRGHGVGEVPAVDHQGELHAAGHGADDDRSDVHGRDDGEQHARRPVQPAHDADAPERADDAGGPVGLEVSLRKARDAQRREEDHDDDVLHALSGREALHHAGHRFTTTRHTCRRI
jgi:hypothetical protein